MSVIESQVLSKVLDENNVAILNRYNVREEDFYSLPDTYKFIKDYQTENGKAPDYRTVVAQFPDFEYMPEVVDDFKYLTRVLKSATAKRGAVELLQNQAGQKFSELNGQDFIKWLVAEATHLEELTASESFNGENWATTGAERWEMYEDGKENRTFKFIPTPYPSLTEWLGGGFELGDYVLLQAYTNRGKSWVASDVATTAWREGYGVLHYSPELSYSQQAQRNDTLVGHFNNIGLKTGTLRNEKAYKSFLDTRFNEEAETPYIIKTMEHLPKGLGLDVIEADLQANPNIKMVIIDGFNLMSHKGRNDNRGNMSNTSRRLRQLFSRYQVVGVVVHQTPTSAVSGDDEAGARIVKPAKIHEYSETIAVVQDAVTVLSFDQSDGVGKILLAKARTPNVDNELTLHCDFNNGFIREAEPILEQI